MSNSDDLTIYYFGASGGFFALYMLLLTKNYQCCFQNGTADVFGIKDKQWDVKDVAKWKDSEIWPDNVKTLGSSFSKNKIYFVCNPEPLFLHKAGPIDMLHTRLPGKKLLLYTDLKTQWYLAKTKRAFWFQNGRELNGTGPMWRTPEFMKEQFQFRYKNAQQEGWPECHSVEEFYSLPQSIQDECLDKHHFWEVLDYKKFEDDNYFPQGVEYNGDIVYKRAVEFMPKVDIVVKLQDIIKTKGKILFDQLGIESNSDVNKFLIQYLSLHTNEQRNYLLSKNKE